MSEEVSENTEEQGDDAARAVGYLKVLFEKMDMAIQPEAKIDGRFLRIDLNGDDAMALVTGKGASAGSDLFEALQLLVARSLYSGDRGRTIVVDAAGFRAERCTLLEPVADRVASLTENTECVRIHGMNAFDRRGIHVRLADRDDIATDSEGNGVQRTLLVTKKTS